MTTESLVFFFLKDVGGGEVLTTESLFFFLLKVGKFLTGASLSILLAFEAKRRSGQAAS
jgi:hypothetical protein